jgi:hypothetical protein
MIIDELLGRLNTAALVQGDPAATRALVVVNSTDAAIDVTVARFHAAFPVRAAIGAQPVTVRDERGNVVPSRLVESALTVRTDLPPDRRLWTLTLEFVGTGIPARGWRTYAATFGASPESRDRDEAFWSALPCAGLVVYETDCHAGDLATAGSFDATGSPA